MKACDADVVNAMLNRESNRVGKDLEKAIEDGFYPWSWWHRPIEEGDEVRQFGMVTFWKPKRKELC